MNIKKFLTMSLFALQFSNLIYASDQAGYNAAFLAFDKAFNNPAGTNTLAQAASYISNNAGSVSYSKALKTAQTLNTPQSMAVGLYLSDGNPATLATRFPSADVTKQGSTILFTNLITALSSAASGVTTPAATTTTTPVTTTTTLPQLSDTTNWAAAFTAFGGVNAIANKTASSVMPSSITASSAAYGDAQVIVKYLTNSPMNSVDAANLNNAITSAQAAAATTTANANATDNAAAALKSQIDSSLVTYNSYLTSVSKAPVKIIAA